MDIASVFVPHHISVPGDSLSTVEVYDPIIGRWQLAEAMSMLRSRVGVAVMHNRLYAFGGYNGCERLSTVEVFDPQQRVWSRVSRMHYKRRLVHVNLVNFIDCLASLKSIQLHLLLLTVSTVNTNPYLRFLQGTVDFNSKLRRTLNGRNFTSHNCIGP